MKLEITDPKEIEALMEYRKSSADSKPVVDREIEALDTQRKLATEANSMSVADLGKSKVHQDALIAEVARLLAQRH